MATEVVVIGGGVVGVSAALILARWGVPVVVFEKGRVAGEQSSRNWGWIRAQGRDFREMELMLIARRHWQSWTAEVGGRTGLQVEGVTYLAEDEETMARYAKWVEDAAPYQLGSRVLSSAEADAHVGQDRRRFLGGIFTPGDMHAAPDMAVGALADHAAAAGADIFEHSAVRTLEQSGGRITGVVTEHGRIACQSVILAGGAWCRPFLENAGAGLAQLAVGSQALATGPAPAIAPGPVGTARAAVRPRAEGGYTVGRSGVARFDLIPAAFAQFRTFWPTLRARWRMLQLRLGPEFFGALGHRRWQPDQLSPFEAARALDPTPDPRLIQDILTSAKETYPQLKGAALRGAWGGMIDVTPDEVPVIGPVGGLTGLTVASGLSGHGFGLGPGVGQLAAELATGRTTSVDPAPFDPGRFRAGRAGRAAT
ncbi:MAG: FAD-binding oxidoreductase [Pseudomonadota bacterium]